LSAFPVELDFSFSAEGDSLERVVEEIDVKVIDEVGAEEIVLGVEETLSTRLIASSAEGPF
jgi:nucleoside-triphosphatase THEP1